MEFEYLFNSFETEAIVDDALFSDRLDGAKRILGPPSSLGERRCYHARYATDLATITR